MRGGWWIACTAIERVFSQLSCSGGGLGLLLAWWMCWLERVMPVGGGEDHAVSRPSDRPREAPGGGLVRYLPRDLRAIVTILP